MFYTIDVNITLPHIEVREETGTEFHQDSAILNKIFNHFKEGSVKMFMF
jgi:hypothetical protein